MNAPSPEGRACLLTAPGRGAVAVIAAEGPAAFAAVDAHFHAANRLWLSAQRIDRIVFGHWHDATAANADEATHRGEEVIVCRTGAAAVEVHCHGGVVAASRILAAFTANGCRIEPWAEWMRAHASSVLEAEADHALAAALTRRTAAILLEQRHGALRREIAPIIDNLRSNAASQLASARERLVAICERVSLGRRLTQPWQIAVAGRPNVGKSSLMNALVGYERAIVFDQPGTTRDVLAADTAIDGWPVRMTDSAGLRATSDPLEAAGVALAQERLAQADLVLWILDAGLLTPADLVAPQEAARREMAAEQTPTLPHEPLVVLNKIDLVAQPPSSALATCALTRTGIPELLAAISRRLVPQIPPPGAAVPFAERQFAALRGALNKLDASNVAGAASMLDAIAG